ncbi:hypothetical protein PIROE2DRAFT_9760 [Piromyces sp. E2]|nr:hypothetical protein PIROE2DRAFT_9760 [Piromyces sp. E2]|eukprot:OUM63615.1 hypothetical protein PIROE2DRAFT_9760 [Piromyces sp. E2]
MTTVRVDVIIGNGKSSLCNLLLGKKLFSDSDRPESETKSTKEDRKHIIQMVQYIKEHPELQAILIVFNFHQPKLPSYVSQMIKLLCNIFSSSDIWRHVALVWSKCYYYIPKDIKKNQIMINNTEFMPNILELVKETNGNTSIKSFPTFYIDSDFKRQDPESIEEIDRLIAWVHSLPPIDVSEVKAADPKIKKTIEEKDIRKSSVTEGNIEHVKTEYYKRNKYIHYDESVTFSNWEKYDEKNEDIIHPKKLLKKEIEKKKNQGSSNGNFVTDLSGGLFGPKKRSWRVQVGVTRTTTIDYYEREIRIYNDNSVEEGSWRKVDTKVNSTVIRY